MAKIAPITQFSIYYRRCHIKYVPRGSECHTLGLDKKECGTRPVVSINIDHVSQTRKYKSTWYVTFGCCFVPGRGQKVESTSSSSSCF